MSISLVNQSKNKAILSAILVATSLTMFKFTVGISSGSLALMASAVDSLTDVFVSIVNWISIREADKPADREHLYGHGKIESLAGLFQSLLIMVSGLYLVFEALRRLVYGTHLTDVFIAILMMIISMAITFVLVQKLKKVGEQTESLIIKTEAVHYTMDYLVNAGIIVALILVKITGLAVWDLLIALGLALYILKQAFGILKSSIDELLDRSWISSEQKKLEDIITNFNSKIVGFHNLRTRKIGTKKFIDFHIEIRGEDNFRRAHDLTEDLIAEIESHFPDSDITVHYDPEGAR